VCRDDAVQRFGNFEGFYVLEGGGIFILNGVRHSFEKGGTYIDDRTGAIDVVFDPHKPSTWRGRSEQILLN